MAPAVPPGHGRSSRPCLPQPRAPPRADAARRKTKPSEIYQVRKAFWRMRVKKQKAFLSLPSGSLHTHVRGSVCPAPCDLLSETAQSKTCHVREGREAAAVFGIPSFLMTLGGIGDTGKGTHRGLWPPTQGAASSEPSQVVTGSPRVVVPQLKTSHKVKERMNLSTGGSQTPALLPIPSQASVHPSSPSLDSGNMCLADFY